jgi:hypothetical protein
VDAPGGEDDLVQTRLVDGQLAAVPRVDARLADVHHHHLCGPRPPPAVSGLCLAFGARCAHAAPQCGGTSARSSARPHTSASTRTRQTRARRQETGRGALPLAAAGLLWTLRHSRHASGTRVATQPALRRPALLTVTHRHGGAADVAGADTADLLHLCCWVSKETASEAARAKGLSQLTLYTVADGELDARRRTRLHDVHGASRS